MVGIMALAISNKNELRISNTMSKGFKRVCQNCKNKFYDLNKDQIICPHCESVYTKSPEDSKNKKLKANEVDDLAKDFGVDDIDEGVVFDDDDD
jgi:hypothetical protein